MKMSLPQQIAELRQNTRWSDNNAIVHKHSDPPKQTIAARPRFAEKSKFATPGAKPIDHFSDQIPFDLKLRHWHINQRRVGACVSLGHEAHFLCSPSISA